MTHRLNQRELVINLSTSEYQINPIRQRIQDIDIVGPVDYGWARYKEACQNTNNAIPDIMTWGGGPLAGSRIPGTRRLVFCGYSPHWEGFYISSLGGATYILHRVGVDFVAIHGAAPTDSVLILNHQQGEISVRLEPINPDLIWTGYAGPTGERQIGFYALQQAVYDRYHQEFDGDWVRVFAVGPAARNTNQGIIGSNAVRNGQITPIDDWAGRGGLGSQLLQAHHIAACIFGGDWTDPDLKDSQEIDSYFRQYYNESMIKVDLGATEKYRYVPGFETGGTFGTNLYTVNDNLFSFNYASIYETDQARLDQHRHYILNHYLKQYNEEIIVPKNYAHCGEPCSVACKKYDREFKKDYEPYEALGPQCGIFDHRAAEQLNHFVDAMGVDAIQMGGTVAWIMELVHAGLIPPEDFNLPPASEMDFTFRAEPGEINVVESSQRNAEYAQKVVYMILMEAAGQPFRQGIRYAAKALDERYHLDQPGKRTVDRAVFLSQGKQGNFVPNQYWVPGMFSPMPMMGKYYVYYGLDYRPPRELGKRCVERMVFELFSDNSGVCRFHRKWSEAIVDDIISAHYRFNIDYKSHQFELSRQIYEAEGSGSVFWESERTIDLIAQYLEKLERSGSKNDSLHEWVARFRQDKWAAGRVYWEEVRAGIDEAFAAGVKAIPDSSAPFQAAKLDMMEERARRNPRAKYIAAIDQGTTSTRCMIFNLKGMVVTISQKAHRQIIPQPGWVEHDPMEIWERTQEVVRLALTQAGLQPGDLAALGITNQRETTIIWDKHTGQPYYNALVWEDARTKDICDAIIAKRCAGQDCFREKTGLPCATYFSGPKIKWIMDNIPGVRQAVERGEAIFGNIDTWLIWWLTGGPRGGSYVTDVTNASRTMLMNLKSLDWDEEILAELRIPRQMLPRIVPSSDPQTWGVTTLDGPFGAMVPVCGDLGDQQAALLGHACFSPGEAKNTYATGCFMLLNTGTSPVLSNKGLLTTLAYQIGSEPAVYALEGSVANTGALVHWMRDNLGWIQKSSDVETLARSVEDNGGAYIVPAFSGLYAPYWRSDARGAILGLTRYIKKGHLVRAVLESIAFQMLDVLEAMHEDAGVKLLDLKVDGGMVYNELLMQFTADLLNIPVVRPRVAETTPLGTAYAAGLAIGFWDNLENLRANWQVDKTWQPQMDEKTRAIKHRDWKKAVERTFDWVE
jgi:glycerol kinase